MLEHLQPVILAELMYRSFYTKFKHILLKLNVTDISYKQAIIIYIIGHNCVRASEILRYLPSKNVSYNIKKLLAKGYVIQTKLESDERVRQLKLTEKGIFLYDQIINTLNNQTTKPKQASLDNLTNLIKTFIKNMNTEEVLDEFSRNSH